MVRLSAVLLLTSSVALTFTTSPADARYLDSQQFKTRHAFKTIHLQSRTAKIERLKRYALRTRHRGGAGRSLSLNGVTPVLAAKARGIVSACGSTIISTISARGHRSNHPIGRAVDMRGNPSCIYAQLKGWPGGYSTDYGKVQHVHISYNPGGQEWGLHFAHGGTRHYGTTRLAGEPRLVMQHTRHAGRRTRIVRERAPQAPQFGAPVNAFTLHQPM